MSNFDTWARLLASKTKPQRLSAAELPAIPQLEPMPFRKNEATSAVENAEGLKEAKIELSDAVLSQDDYEEAVRRANDLIKPRIEAMNEFKNQARNLGTYTPATDYTIALNTIDSLFGSQLGKGYQAPETKLDRDRLKFLVEKSIADDASKAADDLRDYIKASVRPQYKIGETIATDNNKREQEASVEGTNYNPRPVRAGGKGPKPVDFSKDIEKYTANLDKDGIPQVLSAAKALEAILPAKGKDIPDFGGGAGILASLGDAGIPLVSSATKAAYRVIKGSPEVRNAFAGLRNAVSRANFGSAQTKTELLRLIDETQSGVFSNDNDFRKAVGRITRKIQEELGNREAFINSKPGLREAYIGAASATATGPILSQDSVFASDKFEAGGGKKKTKKSAPSAADIDKMSAEELKRYLNGGK